jgi:hypothetical protein
VTASRWGDTRTSSIVSATMNSQDDEYRGIDPRRRLAFKVVVVVLVIGLVVLITDLFIQLVL